MPALRGGTGTHHRDACTGAKHSSMTPTPRSCSQLVLSTLRARPARRCTRPPSTHACSVRSRHQLPTAIPCSRFDSRSPPLTHRLAIRPLRRSHPAPGRGTVDQSRPSADGALYAGRRQHGSRGDGGRTGARRGVGDPRLPLAYPPRRRRTLRSSHALSADREWQLARAARFRRRTPLDKLLVRPVTGLACLGPWVWTLVQ